VHLLRGVRRRDAPTLPQLRRRTGSPADAGVVNMRVLNNGVALDILVEGAGEPVLLLHGWPETKELWREQVAFLAANGFQVIAPDLRGFGQSDKPEGIDNYNMVHSVLDVVAILDAAGVDAANVVGHDFGAGLAWSVAAFVPNRVRRLVAMSVGHPLALHHADLQQHSRMWYTLLFQFEGIAEGWLSRDGWANLRTFLVDHPDLDRVVESLSGPGALTATLNWYRANLPAARFASPPIDFPPVQASTLAVWSDRDHAMAEPQMTSSQQYVEGSWGYVKLEGVGHFIPLDVPDQLNQLLLSFFAR
jgi:pimeloyl-ACP methyl ester carboxylesterase